MIGPNREGLPVRASDLQATGPMMALLSDALLPNLVQTTEGTPATVHCGPFANIAHGTSSVISQQMGLGLADYVVNETGFASDLGLEKYMDLVSPSSGIKPSIAVLVTTVRSMKQQGEGDLKRGFANLDTHIRIVRGFGLPAVVAINRFPEDTEAELESLRAYCEARGAAFALSEAFAKGGEGAAALARKVVEVIEAHPDVTLTTTYEAHDPAVEKITKVAQKIYGADGIELSERGRKTWRALRAGVMANCRFASRKPNTCRAMIRSGWARHGGGSCIDGHCALGGAGFLVVIGAMMLMPGLPKRPAHWRSMWTRKARLPACKNEWVQAIIRSKLDSESATSQGSSPVRRSPRRECRPSTLRRVACYCSSKLV